MNDYSLEKLFRPERIALVGVSETPGKVGNIILNYLERSFAELFLVNPKINKIGNRNVNRSVNDLPDDIDLVIITLGAIAAVEVAEICSKKGAAFIIIVAGGFGEIGNQGKELEKKLKDFTIKYGTRIIGPNSLGVFYPDSKLDTLFVEHGDKALAFGGGIAFITQSGSVGVESLGFASNSGYGMRAFIGTGNKVDMNESDFLSWFAGDAETKCLAFYLENIENGRVFLEKAGQVSVEKPIVVLKAGRTDAGGEAVNSHTGKLAGSDNIIDGAFRQFGIQRAYDDEELCDASKVLSMTPPAEGNRVAVITPAGGFGVMCADYIDSFDKRADLKMASFSNKTVEKLKSQSFSFASVHNPLDLTAVTDDDMYINALEALIEDSGVDIVICITFFAPPSISNELVHRMSVLIRTTKKPVLIFTQYGPNTDYYLKEFFKEGVAGFPSVYRTVRAARYLVERGAILAMKGKAGE